jgi:hypothetical protein
MRKKWRSRHASLGTSAQKVQTQCCCAAWKILPGFIYKAPRYTPTALFEGRRKVGYACRGLGSFGMEVFTESRQAHRLLPDSVTPDLVPYIQNMEYIPIFRAIFFEYSRPAILPENLGQCSEFSRFELSELNLIGEFLTVHPSPPRLARILLLVCTSHLVP